MPLSEPFRYFIDPLEKLEMAYGVTGSVAASIYGEPRMTGDIDLVLLLDRTQIPKLQAAFPETDFYLPPEEVLVTEILRGQRGSFNVIHHGSGFKADVYLVGKDALQAWAIQHRRRVAFGDGSLWLAPPEYVIIRKLEFLREGAQEKHARDIRFMLSCTPVDDEFLTAHIKRLALEDQWQLCREEGTP
jgi:hypothetical protein